MFEPIGGSAPKYTGQNKINPLAAISAVGLMMDHLGEQDAADAIESSVMEITAKHLKSLAAGNMGMTTSEVGDMAAGLVAG
ncbi:MAG: 3-isopropylmalate dehydrogenase, partial [Thermodesulfovibrionales bacterium]|nr:3-isopropylmalate dehydrogenase [Thermodesulfovibrionales bacterium]